MEIKYKLNTRRWADNAQLSRIVHAFTMMFVLVMCLSTSSDASVEVDFRKLSTLGLHYLNTFQDHDFGSCVRSERFVGDWEIAERLVPMIKDDLGLKVMNEAQHHAISCPFKEIVSNDEDALVVSYEVKFEKDLHCGGAYLKLFDATGIELESFDNETPYVIMFGPDRCAPTNKVHLIIKHQNPMNGVWSEHHLKDAPLVPYGTDTHLYTLHIKPDDTYEVLVDNVVSMSGSMHEDFEPPFTAPLVIDDPNDMKPDDWVDDPMMPDITAVKPDDWDDTAEFMIPDPESVMPEGWNEDEPLEIPDEEAVIPDDWSEEDDGPWQRPMIPNPACVVGCGPWTPPMIRNPNYREKWRPPMIPNPEYKGEWKRRQVPNPYHFVEAHPHRLSGPISAVGFELWTMQNGILFDNLVVSKSMEPVQELIKLTFEQRKLLESQAKKSTDDDFVMESSFMNTIIEYVVSNWFISTGLVALAIVMLTLVVWRLTRWFWRTVCRLFCRKAKDTTSKARTSSTIVKPSDRALGKEKFSDDEEEGDEDEKRSVGDVTTASSSGPGKARATKRTEGAKKPATAD